MLFLPDELLLLTLSHLPPEDIFAISRVCKRLNQLAADDILWRRFCGNSWRRNNHT